MSRKKYKKRHPQGKRSTAAAVQESEFSTDGKRKRMNPAARNILLVTLVILAASQMLYQGEMITEMAANVVTGLALVLVLAALWMQFRSPTGQGGTTGNTRLR